jgi:hypothetical protein
MKRLFGYVFSLLIVGSSLMITGCKKGENDPFFSIYSRKQRVTGYWDFKMFERQSLTKDPFGVFTDEKFTVTDADITDVVTIKQSSEDTTITYRGKVKEAYYKFEKDGRMDYRFWYEMDHLVTRFDENTQNTASERTITTVEIKGNGTWNFLDKIDNYNKKERLSLVFEYLNHRTTVSFTYDSTDVDGNSFTGFPVVTNTVRNTENKWANGEFAEVWVLDMLKNKELNMYRQLDNLDLSSSYSSDTTSSFQSSSTTTVGLETCHLVQNK